METTALSAPQSSAITTAQQPSNALSIAQQMSERGATIEQMNQFFDFAMRVEADQARKAFNEAMNQFKSNLPTITKNKHVHFKSKSGGPDTDYWHATHDNVVKVLVPALNEVGIRHRWKMSQDNGMMTVTCILTHTMGHSEEATLSAAYDQSGGKNSIQAVVSSKTYLERHTFVAVTGLTTEDDDDGRGSEDKAGLPDEEIGARLDAIRSTTTPEELKRVWEMANKAAEDSKDQAARLDFGKAKNEQYRKIKAGIA